MKKFSIAALGVFAALILTACSGQSGANKVDATEFSKVAATAGVVVLDVRTPAEFASGHIANAINIDYQSGRFEQDIAMLAKNTNYAVYCHSGNRSAKAIAVMNKAGFKNLTELDGGIIAWQAAGGQLIR